MTEGTKMEQTPDINAVDAQVDSSIPSDLKKTDQVSPPHQAFTDQLDKKSLNYFNSLTEKPFSEQAVAFLNAYWEEIGDQVEFIFTVAWEMFKYADMHAQGTSYVHLYDEGNQLDFNIGLYFYEKLCKKVLDSEEGKKWRDDPQYKVSMPEMLTAIVRKKELREKVDFNFDGKISFLEYLLYQYGEKASPQDFADRSMKLKEEHPEVVKAKASLKAVNEAVKNFEQEKTRLNELAEQGGVKGMGAKHELAIINAGPLANEMDTSMITAEAAVRKVTKEYKGKDGGDKMLQGSVWWMNKDLEVKKSLYAKKTKK